MENEFLYNLITSLARVFKPKSKKRPEGFYSPHIKLYGIEDVQKAIDNYRKDNKNPTFLDIGGRNGEFSGFAKGFDYKILEIDTNVKKIRNVIYGDICNAKNIKDETIDICFSNNVFEHIKEPWAAAAEISRILKPNGLVITIAPFAWRYHPVPVDYFRYSHDGLGFLFERTNKIERVISGYDLSGRRANHNGGKLKGGLDAVPIDELGGWREHWMTIYIGKKLIT